ncbi:flavonoid 3'-monooxygenase-like protein [Cinnamomum micranthum f. kanehirae]|uniref:Flavonoid 3'-monooxygenase-like protein n=1 Tax=Cinnamomum micranthum f. kanehirae TaxID=337451 RepID=A0A3S3MPS5_9MAGN|nr:flavonoid 3'-monooxygenase-like protein [Cinnamomum micranthum f. kanehirae]
MASEPTNPMSSLLTISLLLFTVAWYLYCFIWPKVKKTAPLPPGPKGLPLVGYLPFLEPDLHRFLADLARTYGPIFKFRLGAKLCIVVSSPGLAKEILRDHDATFANRDIPAAAVPLSYGVAGVVFSPHCPEWRMLRKVSSRELMSSSTLDSYYGLRQREVRRAVAEVHGKAGREVEVGELMFLTAGDVITSMVWGGTLDGEGRRIVGAEFREVTQKVLALIGTANMSDLFPLVGWFDFQGVVRRMKELMVWMDRIFNSVIERRRKMVEGGGGSRESGDFLQLLLQLKESGDPKAPLSENNVKALLMDIVGGGTDTSSTTIEWAMAEMMAHPEVLRKAQDELEQVVGLDNAVEETHLPKLSYLSAILKELLRLHPPVPFLVPRSPSQACTVGGYMVPTGARVMVNVWAIQRDPDIWAEPLEFRPERFLMDSTSKCDFNGQDFRYLPFGSGRRVCMGIPMAERTVMYTFASLIHSFEWQLPEGRKLDLSEKFGIILKKKNPLLLIPTPRLSNPHIYSFSE